MQSEVLKDFSTWLMATPLSVTIQNTSWAIPALQSVHILAIAVVIASATMVGLRLLGVIGRDQPTAAYTARFLPWIWPTLVVLLITGGLLLTAEPNRAVENPAFQLKMLLLIFAILTTLTLQIPLRQDGAYWELTASRKGVGKVLAVLSLGLWAAIIFCGRWIAYANLDG